jgi:hypothetical protein
LSIKHGNRKEETAMAEEESEFQKLLSEAPAAPSADSVTVTGALSRTADPSRFVLTLPNGQSATVEVAAVKSSKRIAGAIGQVLVELELDAKKMPEKVLDIVMKPIYDTGITLAAYDTGMNTGVEHNTVIEHISVPPANDTIHETILGGPGSGLGTVVPPPAPFAAAMPHQTSAGLHLQALHKKPPQMDLQVPPKQPVQDGTNPWNSFDITGFGGFDVITYHNGQPVYNY